MKSKKRKHLLTAVFVLVGLVVSCGAMYMCLLRYFFFNKYNVHAQRAALNRLNVKYHQEFELLSTEFETRKTEIGGASYVHVWTYAFQDGQGRQFYTYVRLYGEYEKGDGLFYEQDYFTYVNDTYGQLCLEERLGDKYDLYKYRQDKVSRFPEVMDYIFIYTKDNAEEIAEMLTEIYFAETEFSNKGCLQCRVNNEEGEKLFMYYWSDITRNLQEQNKENKKEAVYAYILQEIQN